MKVKIKKLTENAKVPTQAHDKDFCYDVYATSCKRVGWRKYEYGIGLAFELVRPLTLFGLTIGTNLSDIVAGPDVKLSIDFRPRSSVHKTGMILSNCEGTIDELFRGEIKAYFYKVTFGKKYKVGDRIGQIKLGITLPLEFEELDMNTERGTAGFGSTGLTYGDLFK